MDLSCSQVLFQDGRFQWERLENLITLAREGMGGGPGKGLDLSDTVKDALRVMLVDDRLRTQVGAKTGTQGSRVVWHEQFCT